jgi:heme/copper-type cytochrome/quinol oxidase subunit 2
MGNIPLATVLNANGVLFAGIMGFIYSDLMVPPLVAVNAKYYGWKTAIYIAIIMYVSIVLTAITLHYAFAILDVMPTSARKVEEVAQFKLDYSFWMNIFAALLTGILIYSHYRYKKINDMKMKKGSEGLSLKKISTYIFVLILIGGFCTFLLN